MKFERYYTEENVIYINWDEVHVKSLDEMIVAPRDKHETVLWLTDWRIQRQLIDPWHPIMEVFDKNIKTSIEISNNGLLITKFNVGSDVYNVIFKLDTAVDEWIVIYQRTTGSSGDLNPFSNKMDNTNAGEVIAGVFRSIEYFLQNRKDVKVVKFSTNDKDLKDFYTKLTPYIHKRLPLRLSKKYTSGNNLMFEYEVI